MILAALLLLHFALDWSLHVPKAVRWIHLASLVAIPGALLVRELVRPLSKRVPGRTNGVVVRAAHVVALEPAAHALSATPAKARAVSRFRN